MQRKYQQSFRSFRSIIKANEKLNDGTLRFRLDQFKLIFFQFIKIRQTGNCLGLLQLGCKEV